APWPCTTCQALADRDRAVSRTWPSIGLPATGCSTLGRRDFMRVPWPAARMTTWRGAGMALFCPATRLRVMRGALQRLHELVARCRLDQLLLREPAVHLGLGAGEPRLGLGLGPGGRMLVCILLAQRRVGEHG